MDLSRKSTNLIEEQYEIESKGNEQSQESQVVEVAGKVVLKGSEEQLA